MDPVGIDLYEYDFSGRPDWAKYLAAGMPWAFAALKATEGINYHPDWFVKEWKALKQAAGLRYGDTFWISAYHYVRVDQDPLKQADAFLRAVELGGGWDKGMLWPVLDVEHADNPPNVTRQQVVNCVSAVALHVLARTGMKPTLYGGSLMADLGITDHMGCGRLWLPRYTELLPATVEENIGWKPEEMLMWQYGGSDLSDEAKLKGYPHTSPIGLCDLSALTWPGGLAAIKKELPVNR